MVVRDRFRRTNDGVLPRPDRGPVPNLDAPGLAYATGLFPTRLVWAAMWAAWSRPMTTVCASSAVAGLIRPAYQGGGRRRSRGVAVRSASPPAWGLPIWRRPVRARRQIESGRSPGIESGIAQTGRTTPSLNGASPGAARSCDADNVSIDAGATRLFGLAKKPRRCQRSRYASPSWALGLADTVAAGEVRCE